MDFRLRKSEISEFNIALKLLKSAAEFLSDKNINQWGYWTNPPKEKIQWVKDGFKNKEFYFIENQNQTILGMVRILKEDLLYWGDMNDSAMYIHSLVIEKRYKGQQIGKRVVQKIENDAKNSGIKYLRLDCDSSNENLCEYYTNIGFNKVGEKLLKLGKYNLYEKQLKF